MKIRQHPRLKDVLIGDEVWCYGSQLCAQVEEVFPAAVCVRLMRMQQTLRGVRLVISPQLWRADEIENLSVCRYCGDREDALADDTASIPYRICATCRSVQTTVIPPAYNDHVSY